MTWPSIRVGAPDLPPIIFLHGFLGRGQDWQPIAQRLAGSHLCILPDLPGHGRNTPPLPENNLSLAAFADELSVLVDSLPAAPILAGYSLGGRVALTFACRYPERLRALVLESASPGIPGETERSARADLDRARAGRILSDGLPVFLEGWYGAGLWESLRQRPDLLQETLTQRSRNDPDWMARLIADLSPGRMPDLAPCLASLELPVLLLAGARDPKYTHLLETMADRLQNGQYVRIEAAGHNIHLEAPEAFSEALQAFLDAFPV